MKKEYSDLVKESFKLRPIAYYPIYSDMAGSILGGIILSQLMYWFRKKNKIFKSEKDLVSELGVTRGQLRTSLPKLKKLPFLHISREGPRGLTHYTINRTVFSEYIIKFIKDRPSLADRYIEELSQHEDFITFYASRFSKMAESNQAMVESNQAMVESNQAMVETNHDSAETNHDSVETNHDSVETSHNNEENSEKSNDFKKTAMAGSNHDSAETNQAMAGSNQAMAGFDISLTETKKTNKTTSKNTVVGLNDTHTQKSSKETPKDSPLHSSSEDKPQKDESPRNTYSPEFEFAWKLYKVNASMKGSKAKAFKAYNKSIALHKDSDVIIMAIEKYIKSSSFEIRPAQAASFFNGICDPGHKYYLDYIKGGYEEKLEMIKAKEVVRLKESLSAQEIYRKDLGKQGELNAEELMLRTTRINSILTDKYGVEMGIFRFEDRSAWVKYTGPDYLALPIKHPRSKTEKVKVLFHIDELRQNLYVHMHGNVWTDKFEDKYNMLNIGLEDMPSLTVPKKEELEI